MNPPLFEGIIWLLHDSKGQTQVQNLENYLRLFSYSKLTIGVSIHAHGYLTCLCWPCDGLATCTGCTLPPKEEEVGMEE